MPKNVGDLGKLIVPKGFKKLYKVQKIAQSGQSDSSFQVVSLIWKHFSSLLEIVYLVIVYLLISTI